jgi:hypothetical protein
MADPVGRILMKDRLWPNSAVRLSITGHRSGKVTNGHDRQESTQSGLSAPMNFSVLCKRGQHHQSLTISGVRSNEAQVFKAVHLLIS